MSKPRDPRALMATEPESIAEVVNMFLDQAVASTAAGLRSGVPPLNIAEIVAQVLLNNPWPAPDSNQLEAVCCAASMAIVRLAQAEVTK